MNSPGHWHEHGHNGDHELLEAPDDSAVDEAIWKVDNVELTTVGIDVGSATTHLMFSRLHLQRQAKGYSSRFVVVERHPVHRSEILLTPYQPDGLIDAVALERFVKASYSAAGLSSQDVDAGAVILTGVALERANARRIAQLFADESGRFVCATAGHNLEALLAAHGSGSVVRSAGGSTVLNVDVGGGTTKYSLCRDGQVAATMAIWGGARLVVLDEGRPTRIEPAAERLGARLGIPLTPGRPINPSDLERLADSIAERIIGFATGEAVDEEPLAGSLPTTLEPDELVFSGGVAEYMSGPAGEGVGDLGPALAAALARRAAESGIRYECARDSIRATVIGASQFSLQLSGNTIHLSGPIDLPIHNIPVVAIKLGSSTVEPAALRAAIQDRVGQLDLADRDEAIAIALDWSGEPRYRELRALAEGIADAHRGSARAQAPIVVVLEADVGASLGSILREEVSVASGIIAIDGIELADLDYVDVGEQIEPASVVPVVIKSLIFPHGESERPRILGSV